MSQRPTISKSRARLPPRAGDLTRTPGPLWKPGRRPGWSLAEPSHLRTSALPSVRRTGGQGRQHGRQRALPSASSRGEGGLPGAAQETRTRSPGRWLPGPEHPRRPGGGRGGSCRRGVKLPAPARQRADSPLGFQLRLRLRLPLQHSPPGPASAPSPRHPPSRRVAASGPHHVFQEPAPWPRSHVPERGHRSLLTEVGYPAPHHHLATECCLCRKDREDWEGELGWVLVYEHAQ